MHFDYMQHLNSYLREEYHSIAEILYKSDQSMSYNFPERTTNPKKPYDACRLHGSLTLNKVAGNFHITAGKSIHFSRGHIHLSNLFDDSPANFSHRIHRLSFGEHTSGIVHPLEGDEKILTDSRFSLKFSLELLSDFLKFNFRQDNDAIFHRNCADRRGKDYGRYKDLSVLCEGEYADSW
jgi:hypothetical protein